MRFKIPHYAALHIGMTNTLSFEPKGNGGRNLIYRNDEIDLILFLFSKKP